MDNISEINSYLDNYWIKYPQEKAHDPSKDEIFTWLKSGGNHFIKDNIFILYTLNEKLAEIVFYWCDMKDIPKNILRNTLKNHKEFIKSLNVPVFSRDIKELFNRKYLISFDKNTNIWRWL